MEEARRALFLGIIIVALGVVMTTSIEGVPRPLGVVLIAVGGLFFIIGMSRKRRADKDDDSDGSA